MLAIPVCESVKLSSGVYFRFLFYLGRQCVFVHGICRGHVFLKLPHYCAADVDEIIEREKETRLIHFRFTWNTYQMPTTSGSIDKLVLISVFLKESFILDLNWKSLFLNN